MLILYASQTGSAQDVAESIWRQARRRPSIRRNQRQNPLRIYAMDDFYDSSPPTQLQNERLIIFVCSTTGQGDEPENMRRFWRFLCRRNLPTDLFSKIYVAVLGLGDSSYQKYNFVAKKLSRRLTQLGARQLLDLGLADDQDQFGYDTIVERWTSDLWTILDDRDRFGEIFGSDSMDKTIGVETMDESPKYRAIWIVEDSIDQSSFSPIDQREKSIIGDQNDQSDQLSESTDRIYSQIDPYFAEITSNIRMTHPDHYQDTRLIDFSIRGCSSIAYLPGDVLHVQPRNLDESIDEFLSLLDHLRIDRPFHLRPTDRCFKSPPSILIGSPLSTFRRCAQTYFDLQSIPRRSFFAMLARFAETDSLEHEKLLEFSSTEGQEDYFAYCTRPRRSIVETMRDFPRTIRRVPLEYWFDLIPCVRPRSFSIASCSDTHPGRIQILVAVVRYKTRLVAPRLGLCSNFLSRSEVGSRVPIWIGKGTIDFPFDSTSMNGDSTSVIMIGPGTGVAPFRSYLHYRAYRNLGRNILFFGCRNESGDFYFRDEYESMTRSGLLDYFVAFSRDNTSSSDGKIYVQHKIREHGDFVARRIVEQEAKVFVAGSAKQMPKDVSDAIKQVLKTYFADRSEDELGLDEFVERYVAKMERERRLQMETWS